MLLNIISHEGNGNHSTFTGINQMKRLTTPNAGEVVEQWNFHVLLMEVKIIPELWKTVCN